MPRNGSGVYSLPSGYEATSGQTALASQHNPPLEDLRDDANAARPIVAGGTGATSASGARTNLGLAIGTNVQAYDATLTSIAALGTAANKGLYATGVDTWAEFDLTAAGRALLDDADASAQRTTLGLGGAATTDLIDEDDMASDTDTQAPTQQSVKAYVDAVSPIVEVARINISDQATAEFDSADFDNATYDSYEFEFINVRPAYDGAYLHFRSSSDGGTTFDNGASDYKVAADGFVSDGVNADFGDQSIDYGILSKWNCGNVAGEPGFSGELKVYGPGDTVYTLFRATTGHITAAGNAVVSDIVSVRLSAAEVNGLQFYFNTGNLESGTIIMRGYRGA